MQVPRWSHLVSVASIVLVGLAANSNAATFYLCEPPASRTLCPSPETGGMFYQDDLLVGASRSWVLPDALTDDVTGTTYGFHLFLSSAGTTLFSAEILVNGESVASTTLTATSSVFLPKGGEVVGVDPSVIGPASVALRLTHAGGAAGRILWGDFASDDSYIVVPDVATTSVPGGLRPGLRTTMATPSPNPFWIATHVQYELSSDEAVLVRIVDTRGRDVRTVERSTRGAGQHTVVWDGRDDQGKLMPGGVYFLEFRSGASRELRKLVFLP